MNIKTITYVLISAFLSASYADLRTPEGASRSTSSEVRVFAMGYEIQKSPAPAWRSPNPISIALTPFTSSKARNRTLFYTGQSEIGNFGCAKPTITMVTNKSKFRINLAIGAQPMVFLMPDQVTSAFAGISVNGHWEAWGPESGNVFGGGKWYTLYIDVSWTCSP